MDEAEMADDVAGMANPRRTDSIQSEFSYEDFFENGIVALHVVGPDGVIQRANKAELELLGYGADEYIGHHLADFYSDRHVLDEILTRLKRGENIHRHPVRMRARNGSIKHVQVTSSPQFQDGIFISTRASPWTLPIWRLRGGS
ncbi:PAS domain S-box protein [Mesorhizobium sp. A623]